jgi:ABC-type uncharacterized transport system substrate-binding protein
MVEGEDGNASACVKGGPTNKLIRAMERFDALGRMNPSPDTAPATAPPSPKAPMTQDVLTRADVEALIVLTTPLLHVHQARIVDFAAVHGLPAIAYFRDFAEAGGLRAYGPNLPELFRRAASYADKILKGAKPGDLPVERPTTFELVINLKTAQALGLTIPPTLLFQATEVIR